MTKIKKIFIALFIVIILYLGYLLIDYIITPKPTHDFTNINLDGINKVMIVAHPDDEMLWGGKELIEDNYLVVCITCGTNNKRVKEFVKVMNATNDKYIMLGYPDKTKGERDDWSSVRKDINNDIAAILALKDWDLILTHNPIGEYGHIHHKMTNYIVTANTDNKDKLYFFGRYYSKGKADQIFSSQSTLSDETLDKKIEILKLYKTQNFIMTSFDHMFEHENMISYSEWKDGVK